MSNSVTDSIYSSDSLVIPLATVQHVEKLSQAGNANGLMVITKDTKWNFEYDTWENGIFVPERLKDGFLSAFCTYRHEIEQSDLMDLRPNTEECPFVTFAGGLCPQNRCKTEGCSGLTGGDEECDKCKTIDEDLV